jgi:hypothetical protein
VPEIARQAQQNPENRLVLSIEQVPRPQSQNRIEQEYYQVYVGFYIQDGGPGHRTRWETFLVDKQLSEILWVNFLTGDSYVPLEDWRQYVFNNRANDQNDWICIPFLRVGPIRADSTLADITKWFGRENIQKRTVYGPEAIETFDATIIYPGSPNELTVFWQDNKYGSIPSSVSIRKQNSRWKTVYGIQVGTEIGKLNEINQRPFFFLGFGWDYGGIVRPDWNKGRLATAKGLSILLQERHQLAQEYYGDRELLSDLPGLLPNAVRVGRIDIQLNVK